MNKEKWLTLIQKQGKNNWLWIAGLAGILLIGISTLFGSESTSTSETADNTPSVTDTQTYARQLEEQLGQKQHMEEFCFLALRTRGGISSSAFRQCFGQEIDDVYADVLQELLRGIKFSS